MYPYSSKRDGKVNETKHKKRRNRRQGSKKKRNNLPVCSNVRERRAMRLEGRKKGKVEGKKVGEEGSREKRNYKKKK